MGDAVTVLVKIRRSLGKIRIERIRISKRKARRTPAVSRFQPVGWLRAIAAGIPFGKAFHVSSVRFSAERHHRIAPARRTGIPSAAPSGICPLNFGAAGIYAQQKPIEMTFSGTLTSALSPWYPAQATPKMISPGTGPWNHLLFVIWRPNYLLRRRPALDRVPQAVWCQPVERHGP